MNKQQFAQQYLMVNSDKFDSSDVYTLKEKLSRLPEEEQIYVQALPLKNPVVTLILSLFFGGLAFDRFYLGDIGLGILKIILVVCFIGWIWVILDWFLTYQKTKQVNFRKLMLII